MTSLALLYYVRGTAEALHGLLGALMKRGFFLSGLVTTQMTLKQLSATLDDAIREVESIPHGR